MLWLYRSASRLLVRSFKSKIHTAPDKLERNQIRLLYKLNARSMRMSHQSMHEPQYQALEMEVDLKQLMGQELEMSREMSLVRSLRLMGSQDYMLNVWNILYQMMLIGISVLVRNLELFKRKSGDNGIDISMRLKELDDKATWLSTFYPDCIPHSDRDGLVWAILDECREAHDAGGIKQFTATARYLLRNMVYEILRYRFVKNPLKRYQRLWQ